MARTGRSGPRARQDADRRRAGQAGSGLIGTRVESLPAAYVTLCRNVRTLVYRRPGPDSGAARRALREIGVAWLGRMPRMSESTDVVLYSAGVMRSLLVEHAALVPDGSVRSTAPWRDVVLRVDAALAELEVRDPLGARLLELRYFAGLDPVSAARLAGVEPDAGRRAFRMARAWVLGRLGHTG